MKKTIENLATAFVGESQARNRYTMYAKTAKKEGYEQISGIFLETADHEKEHAKQLFKMINDLKKTSSEGLDEIKVDASVPTTFGTTAENLKSAIAGEYYEASEMYPGFADDAESEGLKKISNRLRSIGKAEEHHEVRYGKLLKEVEGGTIFKKDEKVIWYCRECGYQHEGQEPPEKCPSCDHEKGFYQIKCEEY